MVRLAKLVCPPRLDQVFTNKPDNIKNILNLSPDQTGLKSDHTYNTVIVEVPKAAA